MNIFVLNRDPVISARDMCDKHIVKMLLKVTHRAPFMGCMRLTCFIDCVVRPALNMTAKIQRK